MKLQVLAAGGRLFNLAPEFAASDLRLVAQPVWISGKVMKVVTWNCNGAFRRKYMRLAALNVDIYVIQECEDPAVSTADYHDWAGACPHFVAVAMRQSRSIASNDRFPLSFSSVDVIAHPMAPIVAPLLGLQAHNRESRRPIER